MFDILTLQHNAENPTLITILMTVLFAFVLSSMVVFTYDKTSQEVSRSVNFMQSLVLISIVAATVMQAIGDSLARGLGMLGALAIIRFRTTLRNPRNMTFMFASIAAGIACGVYGFVIAIVGTFGFCMAAFILRFTPFSKSNNLIGRLRFEVSHQSNDWPHIKKTIKQYTRRYTMVRYRVVNNPEGANMVQYEYKIKMKGEDAGVDLVNSLYEAKEIQSIRLTFTDTPDSI